MARVIHDGQMLAKQSGSVAVVDVWDGIERGYETALPGMSTMGLREAVYDGPGGLDFHQVVGDVYQDDHPDNVVVNVTYAKDFVHPLVRGRKLDERVYLDPFWNSFARVDFAVQCSLAVARDWHRHRTMMPWYLDIVWRRLGFAPTELGEVTFFGTDPNTVIPAGTQISMGDRAIPTTEDSHVEDIIQLHDDYHVRSPLGQERLAGLLKRSSRAYREFKAAGDPYRAMLCLPFGTKVQLAGQAGLRDFVYMLELREHAKGANFEYKAQANLAMALLQRELTKMMPHGGTGVPLYLPRILGLVE